MGKMSFINWAKRISELIPFDWTTLTKLKFKMKMKMNEAIATQKMCKFRDGMKKASRDAGVPLKGIYTNITVTLRNFDTLELLICGRVSHLWLGFEFGKFPLKMANFSIFFPLDQKKYLLVGSESTLVEGGSATYLLGVKSKLGSGWVRAHLYSWWIGP